MARRAKGSTQGGRSRWVPAELRRRASRGTNGRQATPDRWLAVPAPAPLSELSFDQLRERGLNATQSARLIALIDSGREFRSVDELEEIPGFGPATIDKLRDLVSPNRR